MDIADYKKYALPKIEVGKMVATVRKAIKEVAHSEQDVYEKQKEIYKPIIEKLEEEAEELSALKEKLAPGQLALPAPQPQEALPAPQQQEAQPAPQIADLDAGFTPKELVTFEKYKLPLPSKVLLGSYNDDGLVNQVLIDSGKLNQNLGRRKGKMIAGHDRDGLSEDINIVRKYRNRLKIIEEGKKTITKTGSGVNQGSKSTVVYYKNPSDLWDRLQLLGGTIAAGNNSSKVKNEYTQIVHTLYNIKQITRGDLNNLLKVITSPRIKKGVKLSL